MSAFKTMAVFPLLIAVGGLIAFAADSSETVSVLDRVGFPTDYKSAYQVVRTANKTKANKLGTIYVNGPAASIKETSQLPYPVGSIIVMEWAEPLKDAAGVILTDADGLWRKGDIVRLDVMRRETDYGESYGDKRSGEWEFASYRPDGSSMQPPAAGASCAECHQKAGTGRDFVFQGRFPPLEKK